MDGRVRLGLRVDQELPVLDPISDIRCEVREQGEVRERRLLHVREDPEPAARHRTDRASALRLLEFVLAVAEQNEVQLEEPVEEPRNLADDLRRVTDLGGACELDHVPHALLHRIEVPDHERDVSEDAAHARLELGVHVVAESAVDLEVHERLAVLGFPPGPDADQPPLLVADRPDHRVEQTLDRETARREFLGDRVDEEGRVVGVDLDDRAVASVPVDVGLGVEDADGGRLEAAAVREREGGGGEREQLVGRDRLEVVFSQASQQRSGEGGERLGPVGPDRSLGTLLRPGMRTGLGLTPDPSQHLFDLGMELGGGGGAR